MTGGRKANVLPTFVLFSIPGGRGLLARGEGFAANALVAAALFYAALGWRVHPCRHDKTPLTRSWKWEATTDPATIAGWWRQWPRANVAVCTGAPGPDVLDVDCKHPGGMELYARARRAGLLSGAAAFIRTPSGGWHVWFPGTGQAGGAIGAQRALELKATGGYVLVPPSRTDAGDYRLVAYGRTPGCIDWPELRRLLVPPPTRVRLHHRPATAGVRLTRWLSRQLVGNRNSALFWACCRALEDGQADLSDLVATAVALGLSRREAHRTAESARRRAGALGRPATSGPGPAPAPGRARPGRPA